MDSDTVRPGDARPPRAAPVSFAAPGSDAAPVRACEDAATAGGPAGEALFDLSLDLEGFAAEVLAAAPALPGSDSRSGEAALRSGSATAVRDATSPGRPDGGAGLDLAPDLDDIAGIGLDAAAGLPGETVFPAGCATASGDGIAAGLPAGPDFTPDLGEIAAMALGAAPGLPDEAAPDSGYAGGADFSAADALPAEAARFDDALKAQDIAGQGFEAALRCAAGSAGATFLFDLPAGEDAGASRIAAIRVSEAGRRDPVLVVLAEDGVSYSIEPALASESPFAGMAVSYCGVIDRLEGLESLAA